MRRPYLLAAILVVGLSMAAKAGEADDLKARFRQRLPMLNALKDQALVGENNKGFAEFLGKEKNKKSEELVKAENADRSKLYQTIAAGTGVEVSLVGQRRALQIAKEAPAGHMIQDAKGKWAKKPKDQVS